MTNAQAARVARRIPFRPDGTTLAFWPEVQDGLQRIVAKQLRRVNARPMAEQTRAVLREQLGRA